NGLSDSDFVDYGVFSGTNGASYVVQIMQVLAEVIMFFAIIMCVKNYVGELHSGTLKMQLLRPVSRSKTFTAKYLSIYTISFCALLVFVIVSGVIGIIRFGADSAHILGVLDDSKVIILSPFAYIMTEFVGQAIKIFAVCQLTYFVSNLFKGRNTAIAVPIVILLLGSSVEGMLAYGYVGYVGFVSNFNFLTSLSINGPAFRGMKLWTMLCICILWLAGMMTFNYLSFKNKDIN
ncbi:MAG: ABC transporter permease subunit, partial [Clostridia bacterium]